MPGGSIPPGLPPLDGHPAMYRLRGAFASHAAVDSLQVCHERGPRTRASVRSLLAAKGQIRHDTLTSLAVQNGLLGAAEHALHGLEVEPLARHLGRLLVLFVDLEEARRLAGGLSDRL